ncbi:MAG: DMT family transporter [Lachnospiraceae bacterium]|nr:DMT family transporter [Lachnospiraceae bacterium]
MNKIEARSLLVLITFFASIQYIFIGAVGDDYSPFGFLSITNLIGFVMMLLIFSGQIISEMYRVTKKDVFHGIILSLELTGFNTFTLIGVSGSSATVSACILSSYFVFIPFIAFVHKSERPKRNIIIATIAAVIGLGMVSGFDAGNFIDPYTLALVAADICFALYTVSVGKYAADSSPTFLAIGQMLWCFLITSVLWVGEAMVTAKPMSLPSSPAFIICVFYVGIFLKGVYSIAQVNSQRFISPIETSLIFSTEIVMTMLMSPILGRVIDVPVENITILRLVGGLLVIAGILIADDNIYKKIGRVFGRIINLKNGRKAS